MDFKSCESVLYTVPNFEGMTVRERVRLLESLLPEPVNTRDAVARAERGLYAIGKMSSMLMEQFGESLEYSGKDPYEFWNKIAIDCESKFQGNINSLILKKTSIYSPAIRFRRIDRLHSEISKRISEKTYAGIPA